ncbi:CPBP family intramembrane glutamic endopeptidase [Haliscomenobacter sp.]|uniref:CPBP family intramembrane glutamic endopeptidase n=1 Tax=Haliscomenobacter sp. TaxID=2717303 RepID=UPI00359475E1
MDTKTLYLLSSVVLIYLTWHLLHQVVFHRSFCRPANRIGEYFFYRFSGLLFLGVFTYWIARSWMGFSSAEVGINFSLNSAGKNWIFAALIVLPILMLWIGPKKENLWQNPKIRARHWTWSLVILNTLSWVIYLFAYEFFFRGFLLFPCIAEFGLFWAIIINVVLYTLAHFDQGRAMMLGAAIFAVVLSLVSYSSGGFYAAFLIHVINACVNEWISLYHHPEMQVKGLL